MSESIKHKFACDICLDRGWIIEQGFSPALEHRAECVPCPDCRPPIERKPTRKEQWAVAAIFAALIIAAILLV